MMPPGRIETEDHGRFFFLLSERVRWAFRFHSTQYPLARQPAKKGSPRVKTAVNEARILRPSTGLQRVASAFYEKHRNITDGAR